MGSRACYLSFIRDINTGWALRMGPDLNISGLFRQVLIDRGVSHGVFAKASLSIMRILFGLRVLLQGETLVLGGLADLWRKEQAAKVGVLDAAVCFCRFCMISSLVWGSQCHAVKDPY